jgi:hypothetical protein
MKPLMNFLVGGMSNIVVHANVSHIPDGQRSHACLMQRGDESGRLFVLHIPDLVLELPQLFLLRANQPLPLTRAFLLAVDPGLQGGLELVLVLPFATKETPIENDGLLSIVSHSLMNSSQIDAYHLLSA